MPMSLMEKIDPSSSDEDCLTEGSTENTCNTDQSTASKPSFFSGSETSDPNRAAPSAVQEAALLTALCWKKVSFVMVNILGWNKMVEVLSDSALITAHGRYVAAGLAGAAKFGGIPEPFVGDRLMTSFNGVKGTPSHQQCAAHMVMELKTLFDAKLKISAALVSGRCRVGNMGTVGMRRFTFAGYVVSWLHALERHCAELGLCNLADKNITECITGVYVMRNVGMVSYHKHPNPLQPVTEIVELRVVDEEEWMYQLEGRGERFKDWNEAVEAVLRDKWEEAEFFLSRAGTCPEPDKTRSELERAVALRSYTPCDLRY
eukprot:Sspe_Gene.78084::Locus_48838_Transcript_1_1_Confidence_1.000_Length_1065::g.78084::m.78084